MFERFVQLLQGTGTTAAQVAQATGIHPSTFSDWKKGKSSPKMDKLQKIADYFDVPVKFFSNESPFDMWEPIKDRRESLLHYMYITMDTFKALTGVDDINCLTISEYIKFVDSDVKEIRATEDGHLDITVNPWIDIQSTAKNIFSNFPGGRMGTCDIPVRVPVLGTIRAGMPILAEENIIGYEFADINHPEEYFYLRVTGNSMINAGISDGSKVLIHKQNYAENGQIVACLVNGDEATLKRFKQVGDTVVLLPENPKYDPIIVSCKDFKIGYAKILGVAKKVLFDL